MEGHELASVTVTGREEFVDKSKVTLEVPKRLRTAGAPKYVEWSEFKLRTRLMPNGYRVTLAVVHTDQYLYFGASACSPYDEFDPKSAVPRSLGRARQLAFLCKFGAAAVKPTLLSQEIGLVGGVFYLSVRSTEEDRSILIREQSPPLYRIAADNAEEVAVYAELSALERQHGGRFTLRIDKGGN